MKISPPEEIVLNLKKFIKRIEERFQSDDNDLITHAQFRVIFPIVKDQAGYSIKELSRITGIDKGFVSRTISDLESKGIAIRDKEFNSKERNYKINLSEKGRQIVSEKMEKSQPVMEKWLSKVTPEKFYNFIETLRKLTED